MKLPHIHLRAESKPLEARTPLIPLHAGHLQNAGFTVTVEQSAQRIFPDAAYQAAGCALAAPGAWVDAPVSAFILGLKELEDSTRPLIHRHIFFAHAYKRQAGAKELLERFARGRGAILDLEYLVDEAGKRVATFGYWAGYAGAAVAILTWRRQQARAASVHAPLKAGASVRSLLSEIQDSMGPAPRKPSIIIIGAKGRVGQGAVTLCRDLDLEITAWDKEETIGGGPFAAILDHDIFINAVLLAGPMAPFLTQSMPDSPDRTLSVISDISCDPGSPDNPLPIYHQATTFTDPVIDIRAGERPLSLIAIDHLPALLPRESSAHFSTQLLDHLLQLKDPLEGSWARTHQAYLDHAAPAG